MQPLPDQANSRNLGSPVVGKTERAGARFLGDRLSDRANNLKKILLNFEAAQGFKTLSRAFALIFMGFLTGCSNVLPQQKTVVASPFDTYAEAEAAFGKVQPNHTDLDQLFNSGYNITTFPNVEVLTYLDLLARFLPRDSITLRDLDPDLRACLEKRLECRGYILKPSRIKRERVGNWFLDLLDFKRTEKRFGWEAEALFVLHNDMVVYKLWSGTQRIDELREKTNPLGPLQNIGSAVSSAVDSSFD